ncbi:MAG: 4Fe-4S single cluster domain-containing protein [Candidatus Ozemobacteraceae bacterium]
MNRSTTFWKRWSNMRIGSILPITEVEGPWRRTAIWMQGCSIRCLYCCNPHYFDPTGGFDRDSVELADEIIDGAALSKIEGITLLGGEPFDQAADVERFLQHLRARSSLGIILFTGHSWETVRATPAFARVADLCDLVKAGPFDRSKTPDTRRWIGSRNQTTHSITDRYRSLAEHWDEHRCELELHLRDDGELVISGTPIDWSFMTPVMPKESKESKEPNGRKEMKELKETKEANDSNDSNKANGQNEQNRKSR